ncbi:DUF4402 domain-containing protein [Sphingorhabdus contaminans]|jgi:hypothetical protein|uniref:DUF4402 domain-containing protein n=1 Tax=Sphingorhabdus contaminans TaxID=1343899 RepID=A0A553WGT6_9SPHN|nr:DUF4402 domain-containing protein [Sphingorhabdus contaminans]TSB03901.1 DUF4402 domain-containing protein [Sphingorhabdus contaminans]
MCGAKFNWRVKPAMAVTAFAAALLCSPAHADTEPGNAEITVVRPLSFVIDDNLDFGSLIPGTTAGTVTMAPTGARTATNGIVLVGGGHSPATFSGQGTFNQRVDISLGANSIFINGPGAPMRVRTFVIGSTPTAVLTTTPLRFRIAAANGIFTFPLGATLEVGANQAPGKYTGNWSITLNYF